MQIHIEQGRVVIELTPSEFAAFEAMFANLETEHSLLIEGLDWPPGSKQDIKYRGKILPMHLCRTIGEACAVEQAGPLDLLSLYPFWKYGFCFSDDTDLRLEFTEIDPHKKANLADEFGMGFTAWAMEEIFNCVAWCDTADALRNWEVEAIGTRLPDFVCLFKDGSFGVFEAKGTTTTIGTAKSQTEDGKIQTQNIVPKSGHVSVRCACGAHVNRNGISALILRDPPSAPLGDRPSNSNGDRPSNSNGDRPSNRNGDRSLSGAETTALKVDLTADAIIRAAEARRYREKLFGDIRTMFVSDAGEFSLVRTPYIVEKRHGWLDIK